MLPKSTGGRFGHMFGLKAFLIIILAMLFLIPLWMVRGVITERSFRAQEVAREIAGKWAYEQFVQGPFLVIPGERINPASEKGEVQYRKAVLLPDAFSAQAEVVTETRSRGIFDTVVYTSEIKLKGDFTAAALKKAGFEEDGWRLRFDQAVLALGINDLRGIQGDLAASFGAASLEAEPGMPSAGPLPSSGIHWPVSAREVQDGGAQFEVALTLRGSSRLSFLPVGQSSVMEMRGDWLSPSFDGRSLPVEREIHEDGFSAKWDVSHLSRPLPQSWTSDDATAANLDPRTLYQSRSSRAAHGVDLSNISIGASFLQPVDFYLLSERSAKYGLLIVALLFLTFFLFEVLAGIALHPLQYLMVGASLVLFFLGLVALAEVVGFAAAYGLSSGLVAAMVSFYAAAILKRRLWAGSLCGMIVALYALIYLILQLEEVALLAGTLVLFAALGLTMFATRKVDWFNVRKSEASEG